MVVNPRKGRRWTSWDGVADWYAGWAGGAGSEHHREAAIPALLDLLEPAPDESILDLGAGPGALAPYISQAGAHYTGVDLSRRLLADARRNHGAHGRFLEGDATQLHTHPALYPASFDAVTLLLSIQDMDPLDAVIRAVAWALRPNGRVVMLMTHPCFRVPRQSGWGYDHERKLRYRRIDSYLTPLAVPMKRYGANAQHATRSFHRPLSDYVNTLATHGFAVDQVREVRTPYIRAGPDTRAERRADEEIPLFLGLRAQKV